MNSYFINNIYSWTIGIWKLLYISYLFSANQNKESAFYRDMKKNENNHGCKEKGTSANANRNVNWLRLFGNIIKLLKKNLRIELLLELPHPGIYPKSSKTQFS